jgi:hypothetical protein
MPDLDPRRAALIGRIGGLAKSARYDAREGTSSARKQFLDNFESKADPDGTLSPAERRRRADALRRLHFARLALRSAEVRKTKRARPGPAPVRATPEQSIEESVSAAAAA